MTRATIVCAVAILGACGDNLPVQRLTYVINTLNIPDSRSEATLVGLDLDADGEVDNALGAIIDSFSSAGFNFQDATNRAISVGEGMLLMEVLAKDFDSDDTVTFRMLQGSSAFPEPCENEQDTRCSRHLQSAATFTAASNGLPPLEGAIVDGALVVGPGDLRVALPLPGPGVVWIRAAGARVQATLQNSGLPQPQGKVAGGIRASDVDSVILPAFHAIIEKAVTEDCLPSGCAADSTGAALVNRYDVDGDFVVSLPEFRQSALTSTLFSSDLDALDEHGNPGTDGVADSLSFGMAFGAITVTVTE